jgi:hypothetical protein
MRHAIYPGAERAIYAEAFEVPPEREMNLLQEVAPLVRIRLVATRQPAQSRGNTLPRPVHTGHPAASHER